MLYMVFVLEKSRQFCASILGKTIWRSLLKDSMRGEWFFVLPEDTVISIANNEEAKEGIGDMDVKNKVKGILL